MAYFHASPFFMKGSTSKIQITRYNFNLSI